MLIIVKFKITEILARIQGMNLLFLIMNYCILAE